MMTVPVGGGAPPRSARPVPPVAAGYRDSPDLSADGRAPGPVSAGSGARHLRSNRRVAASPFRGGWLLALLLVLVPGFATFPAEAQDTGAVATIADVDRLREALAADSSITDAQRAALSEELNAAARDIEIAAKASAELEELRSTLERGDALIAEYDSRVDDIQRAPATVQSRLGSSPTLSAIEAEISSVEARRAEWAADRSAALEAAAGLAQSDAGLREKLAALRKPDDAATVSSEVANAAIAERISALAVAAHGEAIEKQRALIEEKLRGSSELNDIRTARIAWLDAAIAEADALLTALREAAAASRNSASAQRSAETRRLLSVLDAPSPALSDFAKGNLELIDEFQALGKQIEATSRRVSAKRQTVETILEDAQLTQRRLEVAGLEAKLGDVMLSRLASLPDPAAVLAESRERAQRIAETSSTVIDMEQELRALGDRAEYFEARIGDRSQWSEAERRTANRLYDQRRTLLQENLQAHNNLLRLLVDENQSAEELARAAANYRNLLTGNLLWVRNYSYAQPRNLMRQIRTLLEDSRTILPGLDLLAPVNNPVFLLGLLLLLVLTSRRRAAARALDEMLGVPIAPRDESAAKIFKGLALTFVASLPSALTFALLGRGIKLAGAGEPLARGAGDALMACAVVVFVLGILRRLAGKRGVGRRLLKWNSPRADVAVRGLRWFRPFFAVAVAVVVFGLGTFPTESGGAIAAIGSLSMAILLLLMALTLLRSHLFDGDWILRYGLRAWVLASLGIVIMHLSGQLFAAHLYLRALSLSVIAVIFTLLFVNVLQRILIIYRVGLERKTREERRAREVAAETDEDAASDTEDETGSVRDDAEVMSVEASRDAVSSLSEAYTQLLMVFRIFALAGLLWLIWSPALPALTIFDGVTLWTTSDSSLPPGELRAVTLSVLLIALVVVFITLLITRHLPPLINVLLLEWTSVTAGARYAAGMLLQYLVIGVGFSSAMAMLGFQWEKVQWLVAALGVGIGFGLQEIVANFISGLIVLFERPIRVGDIINAGGHDGTVVNINPRATVIETFEGKEVMIPNKELITNVVTNWSLTSSKLRIVVPVGIAYGSDVEDAIARLTRIANAHEEILTDPAPFITFEDFGDNALILWLRCYALKDYLRIATELRREIYKDFNDAGIGIAFPQRDVHLDASEPLPIRVLRDADDT